MVHVPALFGFGECQSKTAKVGRSGWHSEFLRPQ
jgi:hypothetical protein